MFTDFFKKKPKIIQVPQDWGSYFCQVESKSASIRLNMGLGNIVPISALPCWVVVSVVLQNPSDAGLTTDAEFPIICDIEDALGSAFESTGGLPVGVVKTDGRVDFYYYAPSIALAEGVAPVMSGFTSYKYDIYTQDDPEWDTYKDFLYPDEYGYQDIQNQKVCIELQKNGDNPENIREIDHFIDFARSENAEKFAQTAGEIGFNILGQDVLDNGTYSVHISRADQTTVGHINDIVAELLTLAREHDGTYGGWGAPISR